MESIILVIHTLIALALIGLVMMQQGKGASMGAAFGGGGASQTFMGSSGSGSVLTRVTSILAFLFFITSFSLAVFAKQRAEQSLDTGIPSIDNAPITEQTSGLGDIPSSDIPAIEISDPSSNESSDIPAADAGSDVPQIEGASGSDIPDAVLTEGADNTEPQ